MSAEPSAADLEVFRELLAREAGLRFHDDNLELLADTLRKRTRVTGARTAKAYLARLVGSPGELGELAPTLTVSETYFLRDRGQFNALERILRERAKTKARDIRLLSAGCSSGEEAYSLAMTIKDVLGDLDAWSVSILGVDVNPDVLDRAKTGIYGRWSLRQMPPQVRTAGLCEVDGRYVVADSIRAMVRFEQQNLASPVGAMWRPEAYDIVFCRNVLMYLTPEVARAVVARIARSLAPGGFLFLGHAENLRGLSNDFFLRQSNDTFFYERRGALSEAPPVGEPAKAACPVPARNTTWFEAIARASSRIEVLARSPATPVPRASRSDFGGLEGALPDDALSPAVALMKREKFQEALEVLARTQIGAHPDGLLLEAMLLVSTGDIAGAEARSRELLAMDDLNAGAHYVVAMCREHAGDDSGAVQHSRAAAYLDPDFAMPHLQLGRLARRGGDLARAERELSVALGLLMREDPARVVLFGGGFSREALFQLCRGELEHCGAYR